MIVNKEFPDISSVDDYLSSQLVPFKYSILDYHFYGYDRQYLKLKNNRLEEGLITSVNAHELFDVVKFDGNDNIEFYIADDKYEQATVECFLSENGNLDNVYDSYSDVLKDLKTLVKKLKVVGWYSISSQLIYNDKSLSDIGADEVVDELENILSEGFTGKFQYQGYFEPKYNEKAKYSNLSNNIFHVTKQKYRHKIEKIGLKPSSQKKIAKHKPRIYFLNMEDDSLASAIDFSERLYYKTKEDIDIYKVDKEAFKNINVYYDPLFGEGIYIMDNIRPEYLTLVKTIEN